MTLTILELDRAASTRSHYVFHRVWREVESVVRFDPDFNATHPWYTNASQEELGADGNPFIAHLDGEPGGVVLSQSDGLPGHFAFDGDGTLRWWTAFWDGNAGPWAGRLRPNEPVRAVFATDGGQVVAYDVASGAIQWTFDVAAYGVVPGSISVAPNVFDLRGDGRMSVFVGARQAVNDTGVGEDPGTWMHRQHAKYFLLSSGGQELWSASLDLGNPMAYMHPAAVDLNGDGVKDLVVLDWNTIGHHPGNWEKLGPANLFALDGATGETLWVTAVDSSWSNQGIAIADFLGDGKGQILVEEQVGLTDGLSLYSLQGEFLRWVPVQADGWRITRGPVLADTDGDGKVEVILPVAREAHSCVAGDSGCASDLTQHCLHTDVGCRQGALLVYDTDAPGASVTFSGDFLFDSKDTGALQVAHG
ncbi:MAG: hypothetical protein ABR562_07145 [Thermoplasmatota archaeon]